MASFKEASAHLKGITFKEFNSIEVKDVVFPAIATKFNREAFWTAFIKKNKNIMKNIEDVVTMVLDVTRCHWSPRIENWPGMTISGKLGDKDIEIKLNPGETRCNNYVQGDRTSLYNWTNFCLATAGVYIDVFFNKGIENPNGSYGGITQFMNTVDGYTIKIYDECVSQFDSWIKSINANSRSESLSKSIRNSVEAAIKSRDTNKDNCAYGLNDTVKLLLGDKITTPKEVKLPENIST